MQGTLLDASLRDPVTRVGDGSNVITAGLNNPGAQPLWTRDELRRLRLRKRLEYELILGLDLEKVDPRKECWYLVDANWLNKWAAYVDIGRQMKYQKVRAARIAARKARREEKRRRMEEADISDDEWTEGEDSSTDDDDEVDSDNENEEFNDDGSARELFFDEETDDAEEPGILTSGELVDGKGKPLNGLEAKLDYRGVPSISYFCFKELYGKDNSFPDLPRYVVDIYKPGVPVDRLVPIQMKAQQEAKSLVGAIRPRWIQWDIDFEDEEDEEDDKTLMSCCCCGLTKEHVETFIYWGVRCCFWFTSRRKDERNKIKYREYNPLRYREGDSTRGLDSSHGSSRSSRSSRSSVRSSSSTSSSRSSRSGRSTRSRRSSRRGKNFDGIDYADKEYRLSSGQYLRDMFKFRLFSSR